MVGLEDTQLGVAVIPLLVEDIRNRVVMLLYIILAGFLFSTSFAASFLHYQFHRVVSGPARSTSLPHFTASTPSPKTDTAIWGLYHHTLKLRQPLCIKLHVRYLQHETQPNPLQTPEKKKKKTKNKKQKKVNLK
jgi:hypothetical protein